MVGQTSDKRTDLRCNCVLVLDVDGQEKRVKARTWDCPSCGHDKRRTLATMVSTAGATRLITFTFAPAPAVNDEGEPLTPARHAECDPRTHVWEDKSSGRLTWHLISTCPHCCRHQSRMLAAFTKRVRRRYPSAQRLNAREDHKSGALHVHSAWIGLPEVSRRNRAGRRLKEWWHELGGGWLDLGDNGDTPKDARRVGWYIGKYLAKRHDQRMARGYRRWTRTRGFAPEVTMPRWEPDPDRQPAVLVTVLGWEDPVTSAVVATRVFVES